MMKQYKLTGRFNAADLYMGLVKVGVPVLTVGEVAGDVWVDDSADDATVQAVIAAHVRVPRTLLAIYIDLAALTVQQKANIWSWLTAGSPPRILTSTGPASDSIFLTWQAASGGQGTSPDAKLQASALYCRDNPTAFVRPAWDATINVPGEQ